MEMRKSPYIDMHLSFRGNTSGSNHVSQHTLHIFIFFMDFQLRKN